MLQANNLGLPNMLEVDLTGKDLNECITAFRAVNSEKLLIKNISQVQVAKIYQKKVFKVYSNPTRNLCFLDKNYERYWEYEAYPPAKRRRLPVEVIQNKVGENLFISSIKVALGGWRVGFSEKQFDELFDLNDTNFVTVNVSGYTDELVYGRLKARGYNTIGNPSFKQTINDPWPRRFKLYAKGFQCLT